MCVNPTSRVWLAPPLLAISADSVGTDGRRCWPVRSKSTRACRAAVGADAVLSLKPDQAATIPWPFFFLDWSAREQGEAAAVYIISRNGYIRAMAWAAAVKDPLRGGGSELSSQAVVASAWRHSRIRSGPFLTTMWHQGRLHAPQRGRFRCAGKANR